MILTWQLAGGGNPPLEKSLHMLGAGWSSQGSAHSDMRVVCHDGRSQARWLNNRCPAAIFVGFTDSRVRNGKCRHSSCHPDAAVWYNDTSAQRCWHECSAACHALACWAFCPGWRRWACCKRPTRGESLNYRDGDQYRYCSASFSLWLGALLPMSARKVRQRGIVTTNCKVKAFDELR